MKLAISGKGGVGKTTLAALLVGAMAGQGRKVIAVDADPDANLASALGIADDEPITPLADMAEFIQHRTGAKGGYGGFFKLNPKVDDIPDRFAKRIGDIHILTLGGIRAGGDGCICPATALLKALLVHLILGGTDALVMDMEAGIEHLGRATARSMDALVVVVTSAGWSVRTALRVRDLAGQIGLEHVFAVANRIDADHQLEDIRGRLGPVPLIGYLPTDARLETPLMVRGAGGKAVPGEGLAGNMDAAGRILAALARRTEPGR